MDSIVRVLLLFLAIVSALATSGTHSDDNLLTLRCHPDQAASLLQLKRSFSFFRYPSALDSWQDGTDCCLWEGVGCSNSSGHVTALELSDLGLYSQGLNRAIFNLTPLQQLDLSMNNFGQYNLPASGFERLSLLTHLNLSSSGFQGQIPIGIGKLANLISLDLSVLYYAASDDSLNGDDTSIPGVTNWLWLQEPNFQILVGNLNNLRELYLDGVDMSSRADDLCDAFTKSLPNLRVLIMNNFGQYNLKFFDAFAKTVCAALLLVLSKLKKYTAVLGLGQMASIGWVLLFSLAIVSALATSGTHSDDNLLTLRCHPDQAASLLQLKRSFSFLAQMICVMHLLIHFRISEFLA